MRPDIGTQVAARLLTAFPVQGDDLGAILAKPVPEPKTATDIIGAAAVPLALTYGPNGLQSLTCLCGTPIAGLVPSSGPVPVVIANGQRVMREQVVFGYFSNYQEAELTFDDGSKHITHGCRSCLQNLAEGDAERIYCRDLAEHARLEDRSERNVMPEALWEQMARRQVTSVRLVRAG